MDKNSNNINWFEISVSDLQRAKKFYETIFAIEMPTDDMMKMKMAFFPAEPGNGKACGCLCESGMHRPSADGVVLYLNANPDLAPVLGRIPAVGGKVLVPKTQITPEIGYMAFFEDTEGNKIALHSQK
ncbi:MAG: VOC family protein [Ignavibacteriales bacterium]|nr:VOC family protein [Ignavibacteriales bacterium]